MSISLNNYYTVDSIMTKIENELFIQGIKLETKHLDEIRNLLSHLLENRM